jgi:hypothetical protein
MFDCAIHMSTGSEVQHVIHRPELFCKLIADGRSQVMVDDPDALIRHSPDLGKTLQVAAVAHAAHEHDRGVGVSQPMRNDMMADEPGRSCYENGHHTMSDTAS